jgi:glutamate-1-semialdehyde aminotransferase
MMMVMMMTLTMIQIVMMVRQLIIFDELMMIWRCHAHAAWSYMSIVNNSVCA